MNSVDFAPSNPIVSVLVWGRSVIFFSLALPGCSVRLQFVRRFYKKEGSLRRKHADSNKANKLISLFPGLLLFVPLSLKLLNVRLQPRRQLHL